MLLANVLMKFVLEIEVCITMFANDSEANVFLFDMLQKSI